MYNKGCLLEKICFGQKWLGPCAHPQTVYPKLKPEADPKAVKGWKLSVTVLREVGGAFLKEYLSSLSPYLLQFLPCAMRIHFSIHIWGAAACPELRGGRSAEQTTALICCS